MKRLLLCFFSLMLAALTFVGCGMNEKGNGGDVSTPAPTAESNFNAEGMKDAAKKVGETAKNAAEDVKNGVKNAADGMMGQSGDNAAGNIGADN